MSSRVKTREDKNKEPEIPRCQRRLFFLCPERLAAMRALCHECMGKLENACLADDAAGDLDEGAAALEELEYYAEDLDNALDLVKIGGLQTLMRCCAFGLPPVASSEGSSGDEMRAAQSDLDGCATLRESACGVLAALCGLWVRIRRANRTALFDSRVAQWFAPAAVTAAVPGGAGSNLQATRHLKHEVRHRPP